MTGKFAGRSKETCYKRFLEVDKEVLDAFTSLGKSESLPDESLISMLEKFVCILYGTKNTHKVEQTPMVPVLEKASRGGKPTTNQEFG